MDTATYVTMLIINFVATGLIFVAIIKWKKEEIKPLKHIVPTAVFGLFDIVGLAMGTIYVPIFLPSIAVVVLGVNLRKQQWPSEPKFAAYYKLYIFLLAFCLMPALTLLSITYLKTNFPLNSAAYMLTMMFIIIPALVLVGSDPTNRYGQREPENLVGAGLGFIGSILGLTLMFLFMGVLPVAETFAVILSIISLAAAVLLFLPFFLHVK